MAVLIFSVGLIGLAGLLIVSTRSNQQAFVRTQVTFLASSMADRMRANPVALWEGKYDGDYPVDITDVPKCDLATACYPDDVVKRDQAIWQTQLKAFLPGLGKTNITCKPDGSYNPAAQINMRPPYSGRCTMTIQWAERGYGSTDDKTDTGNLQSFTWVFQP